jgi:large subunit ribosomal protein L24
MRKKFILTWKRSKQPRKQRKYRAKAPLHVKQGFMGCHLSKELKKKYGKRAAGIRRGDKVKIMRGQFKKKTGKIERVDLKKSRVYITGIEVIKKDGTKTLYPIHPSNLIITDLYLDDKKRVKVLERK